MYERVQRKDERVFSYFHDKVRMCPQLKLNMIETKKMICVGLLSRNMASVIMNNGHDREEELLADIRMFTEISTIRHERFCSTSGPGKLGFSGKIDSGPKTGGSEQIVDKCMSRKNNTHLTLNRGVITANRQAIL